MSIAAVRDVRLAAILVLGTALGCGNSGSSSDNGDGPGGAGALRLEYVDSSRTEFEPGELAHVRVSSGMDAPFEGSVGGMVTPVIVTIDGTLLVPVPPVAPGAHTLEITQASARGTLPLSLATYEMIAEPAAYVAAVAGGLDADLAAIVAAEPDASAAAFVEQRRATLAGVVTEVMAMSPAEQTHVAYVVRAIESRSNTFVPVPYGSSECMASSELVSASQDVGYFAGVTAAGLITSVSFVSVPVAVFGAVGLVKSGKRMWNETVKILDNCLNVDKIKSWFTSPVFGKPGGAVAKSPTDVAAVTMPMAFEHAVPKFVPLATDYVVSPEAWDTRDAALATMMKHADELPSAWLEGLEKYNGPIERMGPPDELQLAWHQGNCAITGDMQTSPTGVTLTFAYVASDTQCHTGPFTFYLGAPPTTPPYSYNFSQQSVLAPVCAAPLTECTVGFDACVDLQSDVDHCGACENSCFSNSGNQPACIDGACSCALKPGTILCSTGAYAGGCVPPENCI